MKTPIYRLLSITYFVTFFANFCQFSAHNASFSEKAGIITADFLLDNTMYMTLNTHLTWQTAQQRAGILQKIRHFFTIRNVVAVETPLLTKNTITDVYLEAFQSHYLAAEKPLPLYLQTSPEFAMKRLLTEGYGDIYQLCKAFRHEEAGRYHNPEFTILEWYRLGFDHHQLMDEVDDLLQEILGCVAAERISYQQLFIDYVDVDPLSTNCAELIKVLTTHNKLSDWLVKENDKDVLLQVILAEIIEPQIGQEAPCFIYHFPSSQASLAKISPQDHRVAERFECYFKGIELANGFHELTDAKLQRQRFFQDNQKRKEKGLAAKPLDENFLSALEKGLPDCAGVAVGIDRLIMLACDKKHISEVITFPLKIS